MTFNGFANPSCHSTNFSNAIIALILLGCFAGCKQNKPVAMTQSDTSVYQPGEVHSKAFQPSPMLDGTTPKKKFALVPDSVTGIKFKHQWNPPAVFADRFNSYAVGVGVAIGDVDGDDLPDIYFACQTKGGQLYKNLGGWKFEDITRSAGLKLDGFWGTGTTFVDIDNDGDLDLYLCAFAQPNRLYINDGRGKFKEQAESYGIDYKGASVVGTFADYDNDGRVDMYLVTNHMPPPLGKPNVQLERNPDGTIRMPRKYEQYGYFITPPGRPGTVKPLLVEGAQYDVLYHNQGDGRFVDTTLQSGIGQRNYHGLSGMWWDYDQDGDQDLYVSNDFYGPDHLYKNNGDSTFTDVIKDAMPYIPWFSMGSDAADINNDGLIDLFAADMSSSSHYRAKITMGDMQSEAWFLDYSDPQQYMRNMMFVNSGGDRFLESAYLSGITSTDWTWSVKFGDLDADGLVDLFVTNGMTRDFQNSDLKDQCAIAQKERRISSEKQFWEKLPMLSQPNMAFKNNGDLKFEEASSSWGLDHEGVSIGSAFGDLDGDGDLDIIVNNFTDSPSVYRNDSASSANQLQIRLVGTSSNRGGVGAEIRLVADGVKQMRQSIACRGYMSSDEPMIHFGLGESESADRLEIHWPSGIKQILKDLSGGNRYTIVEPETSTPETDENLATGNALFEATEVAAELRHREIRFDDFDQQPLLPNRLSQLGPDLAASDIDGDSIQELYLGGATGQPGQLFRLNHGSYQLVESSVFDPNTKSEDMGVLFFDADGDGDLDLYVVSGGIEHPVASEWYRDRIYLNDGQGNLTKAPSATLPTVTDSGSCVVAADYDQDGDLDLFVGGRVVPGQYPVTPKSRLFRNDSSTDGVKFVDATSEHASELLKTGMVTAAVWCDVDGNAWPDLMVTHEWGPVKVFINDQGRLVDHTDQYGLSDRTGWWNGIASADFDKDGDQDFVVTNFGSNTKYHPTAEHPALIYYNDFNNDGKYRIVEAKQGADNKLLPIRGRSCSSAAIPMVAEKFPTYHQFALAGLEDIYSLEALDGSLRLHANELRSGVLINNPDGFKFRPLPTLAQMAPGFDVAVFDANADGHSDAFIAQNFFGPQLETGRMAGGLGQLLLGDGTGEFRALWPHESGIVVPGDATAVAQVDFNGDGRPDLVVATNDGVAQAFQARSNMQKVKAINTDQ